MSWWSLGEGSGHYGDYVGRVTCAFCEEKGNFQLVHHEEKKQPNSKTKKLNFDTLQCGNCAGYVMVFWSKGEHSDLMDHRVLPWPVRIERAPEHWPEASGRYWLQAKRNLLDENWDATALMARSALQVALREQGASGKRLKDEVADLVGKGVLPPIMQEWSDEVRELGNDAAHPAPSQAPTEPQDARDVVEFMDLLFQFLYDLPDRIEKYRERRAPAATPD